jgi:DNA topoisomerase-3
MNIGRAMGAVLSENDVRDILQGKKILVKGLKGKKGTYDAYLIPESVEDYSYTKDGKEYRGFQYKFKMEFPKNKKKS